MNPGEWAGGGKGVCRCSVRLTRRAEGRESGRRHFWTRFLPGLVFLGLASLQLGETIAENFRTIVPGCAYRSGQLRPESLEDHVDHYHLRSVINLRGANPDVGWYQEECAVAARLGVAHYDMPTDSSFPPTAEDLRQWLEVLDHCPKPLLIHCQSGIDRTGLLAAVCVLRLDAGGSLERARAQLGLNHGHLPWRTNRGRFLAFLDLYEEWLAGRRLSHSPEQFGYWAIHVYRPLPGWASPWDAAPSETYP